MLLTSEEVTHRIAPPPLSPEAEDVVMLCPAAPTELAPLVQLAAGLVLFLLLPPLTLLSLLATEPRLWLAPLRAVWSSFRQQQRHDHHLHHLSYRFFS